MENDKILMTLQCIAEVEDESKQFSRLIEINLIKLIKNAEQTVSQIYCILCKITGNPSNDSQLEQHHIAGKIQKIPNYPDIITVCKKCHDQLSSYQKSWLPIKNEKIDRLPLYFYGWGDIFELLHNKTKQFYFAILARKFRSQAYHLRKMNSKKRNTK